MRHGLPILLALVLSAPLAAQGPPPPGPPPGGPGMQGPPFEGIEETLEIFRIHKMKEALQLTDEQAMRVLDVFEGRREAGRDLMERRQELMERTRELVNDPEASDPEFRRALKDAETLESEERRIHEDVRKQLASILSPRQQVQYLFFERRFEDEMRRRIEQVRQRWREGGPGARRAEMMQRRREERQRRMGGEPPAADDR